MSPDDDFETALLNALGIVALCIVLGLPLAIVIASIVKGN